MDVHDTIQILIYLSIIGSDFCVSQITLCVYIFTVIPWFILSINSIFQVFSSFPLYLRPTIIIIQFLQFLIKCFQQCKIEKYSHRVPIRPDTVNVPRRVLPIQTPSFSSDPTTHPLDPLDRFYSIQSRFNSPPSTSSFLVSTILFHSSFYLRRANMREVGRDPNCKTCVEEKLRECCYNTPFTTIGVKCLSVRPWVFLYAERV